MRGSRPVQSILMPADVTHTILVGDQKLARRGNVVRHASVDFGDGRRHVPRQAEIEGERRCDSPIILDERTVDLPAAAGDRALDTSGHEWPDP